MQSWLPEAFEPDQKTVYTNEAAVAEFSSDGAVLTLEPTGYGDDGPRFRSETGFTDRQTLMAQLNQSEREQVFELVEMDVAADYEKREKQLIAKQEQQLSEALADGEQRLQTWQDDFASRLEAHVENELKAASAAAARLAVQLAGKIVRAVVPLDPEILTRNIETMLFKIKGNAAVDVTVNPTDAAWLESHPDIVARLGLNEIVADRRIEPGSCLIRSGCQEWDATLTGQLESLSELVEEMIATSADAEGVAKTEVVDEPGLD